MKYSIIIPIYNVEKYLEDCIKSVINQEYDNYELILIDDGSTDKSSIICDKFKKKYDNIIVRHKKNGGVSSARNMGKLLANGDFIIFLDGDDQLKSNCLEKINNYLLQNPDTELLICEYQEIKQGKVISKIHYNYPNDIKGYPNSLFLKEVLNQKRELPKSSCTNVYKNTILHNVRFNEEYTCAEDFDFVMQAIMKSQKISYLNTILIQYIRREDSVTNNISFQDLYSELKVFSYYYYFFKRNNNKLCMIYFANNYANSIYTLNSLNDKKEINIITKEIKKNNKILSDTYGIKYSISKVVWKITGYNVGSKILKIINKVRVKI